MIHYRIYGRGCLKTKKVETRSKMKTAALNLFFAAWTLLVHTSQCQKFSQKSFPNAHAVINSLNTTSTSGLSGLGLDPAIIGQLGSLLPSTDNVDDIQEELQGMLFGPSSLSQDKKRDDASEGFDFFGSEDIEDFDEFVDFSDESPRLQEISSGFNETSVPIAVSSLKMRKGLRSRTTEYYI